MPFPPIVHCLICEEVRAERNNLSSILGFYGMTPDVEIVVRDLNLPIKRIAFLLLAASGGEGDFRISIEIIDPDGTSLVATPEIEYVIREPRRQYHLAIAINTLRFRNAGQHTFRLLVNGEVRYETTFRLRQ